MSTPARKRLMRDFKQLQQDPPTGISGAPQDALMTPRGMKPLLCDPNPNSPANSEAARMFSQNKREYKAGQVLTDELPFPCNSHDA